MLVHIFSDSLVFCLLSDFSILSRQYTITFFPLHQLLGKMVHNLLASGKIDEADTLVSSTESDLCLVSSLEGNEQLREVKKLRTA